MKITATLAMISLFFPIILFANSANCSLSTGINVQTTKQILYVCEAGSVIKEFTISLGRKGTGKKQDGDKKTPIGLYGLASPRKSNRFGVFIPIQYPTAQQLAAGYTGKDVGIHGPFLIFSWLGSLNTIFNWTQGCIAVGKNEQIEFIANWVKANPRATILIN